MRRMPERVLIVDDHASFRAAARAMLEADGFEIAGEAADGAGALDACSRLRPAVVLLDVQLPDLDGFAVAERLSREHPPPRVVLVSTGSASRYRRRLATAPVRGFLTKSELSGERLATLLR
jgi:DNA-binding NarL/FixJ family response regulator